MKRLIALTTIIASISLSCPCYAGTFSPETEKLMREAGLQVDYDVESIMERQEALKSGQANNTTPAVGNGQEKAQNGSKRNLKTSNDEYRVVAGGGQKSTKITDTEDELHIYSDTYSNPSNYSKYSNDEFRIAGQDTKANDGYSEDSFDQLHIDKMYQGNLWRPKNKVLRLGIDQLRLPNEGF